MTTHDRLEQIFRNVFNDDTLTLHDETSAADIANWDSLAHISIMVTIESEFGMRFRDSELSQFANIGELKRRLDGHSGT